MSFIEIDPAEFLPKKSNRTYVRGIRHTPSTLPPEPKHYTWNRDFLSEEHLPFYVGNQVPDPGLKRPHLLQDSSVFYVDEAKSSTEKRKFPKNEELSRRREEILRTNAAILHKLAQTMRPKWQKELKAKKLDPDNTDMAFTDSMQEDIKNAIVRQLLKGTPQEETFDKLTQDLYKLIEDREKQNRSAGHILLGVKPTKEPLVRGTVRILPDGQRGEYHLEYWPADELITKPRVLNGTLDVRNLKVGLTHKYAGSKLLRNILTVKPRELSHNKANKVLREIFTEKGIKEKVTTPISTGDILKDQKQNSVTITDKIIEPVQYVFMDTEKPPKSTIQTVFMDPMSNYIVDQLPTTVFPKTSTMTESYVNTVETTLSPESLLEKYNILRETISSSKNVSSILHDEMEAKERENEAYKEDEMKRKPEDKALFGNWKLQQRIREFKPLRPFPTLPPFVRRWPTFRTQQPEVDAIIIDEAVTTPEPLFTWKPTVLTMRPKYTGPRHEPFFFNDFRRIRTVYPSRSTTTTLTPTGSTTKVFVTETTEMERKTEKPDESLIATSPAISPQNVFSSVTTSKATFAITRFPRVRSTKRRFAWHRNEEDESYFQPETSTVLQHTTQTQVPEVIKDMHQETYEKTEKTLISTLKPSTTTKLDEDDSLFWTDKPEPTAKPYFEELKIGDQVYTFQPVFPRRTRIPKTTTRATMPPTRRSHIHAIKHKVKKGINTLFRFFGFGKSSEEE